MTAAGKESTRAWCGECCRPPAPSWVPPTAS